MEYFFNKRSASVAKQQVFNPLTKGSNETTVYTIVIPPEIFSGNPKQHVKLVLKHHQTLHTHCTQGNSRGEGFLCVQDAIAPFEITNIKDGTFLIKHGYIDQTAYIKNHRGFISFFMRDTDGSPARTLDDWNFIFELTAGNFDNEKEFRKITYVVLSPLLPVVKTANSSPYHSTSGQLATWTIPMPLSLIVDKSPSLTINVKYFTHSYFREQSGAAPNEQGILVCFENAVPNVKYAAKTIVPTYFTESGHYKNQSFILSKAGDTMPVSFRRVDGTPHESGDWMMIMEISHTNKEEVKKDDPDEKNKLVKKDNPDEKIEHKKEKTVIPKEKKKPAVKKSPGIDTLIRVMGEKITDDNYLEVTFPNFKKNTTVQISVAAVSPSSIGRILLVEGAKGTVSYNGKYNNGTLLLDPILKVRTTLPKEKNTGKLRMKIISENAPVTNEYGEDSDNWFVLHVKSM